jgi:F0F1-type ATP synthase membrane subunit b/b'
MPQIDQITFISQIFWLFIIFITFYIVVLENVLPLIGKILKARKKKIQFSTEIVSSFDSEKKQILNRYETLLISSMVDSRQLILDVNRESLEWRESFINSIRENNLEQVNLKYLTTQLELLVTQLVIKKK